MKAMRMSMKNNLNDIPEKVTGDVNRCLTAIVIIFSDPLKTINLIARKLSCSHYRVNSIVSRLLRINNRDKQIVSELLPGYNTIFTIFCNISILHGSVCTIVSGIPVHHGSARHKDRAPSSLINFRFSIDVRISLLINSHSRSDQNMEAKYGKHIRKILREHLRAR